MKKILTFLVFSILTGCGSADHTVETKPDEEKVESVVVNCNYRDGQQQDDYQPYLVDVTFKTGVREINIEYCDTEIKVGDSVTLVPYGTGVTLVYVNEVMVVNLINWEEVEKEIKET